MKDHGEKDRDDYERVDGGGTDSGRGSAITRVNMNQLQNVVKRLAVSVDEILRSTTATFAE